MKQKALSLTEVLISLFILCIGLLAILKTQVHALQAVNNAYYTTQALMRVHSLKVLQQHHPENFSELYQAWQKTNNQLLPDAKSVINQKHVSLSWHDRFMSKCQSLSYLLR